MRDYYEVLGVEKTATEDELKKAHKRLVKIYHPDISKEENAQEKFEEVQGAYENLKDPQKRKNYDTYGFEQQKYDYRGFSSFYQKGVYKEYPLWKKILITILIVVSILFVILAGIVIFLFSLIVSLVRKVLK